MSVPRDGRQRLLNGLALLLVAAGVATYLVAWWRMSRVAEGQATLDLPAAVARQEGNLDRYYALRALARIGIGVTLAGVATTVGAAIRHARRARLSGTHGLPDHS